MKLELQFDTKDNKHIKNVADMRELLAQTHNEVDAYLVTLQKEKKEGKNDN